MCSSSPVVCQSKKSYGSDHKQPVLFVMVMTAILPTSNAHVYIVQAEDGLIMDLFTEISARMESCS